MEEIPLSENNSSPSDSLLPNTQLRISSSPASMAETLDRSPPFSQPDAMDGLALASMPKNADGSSPLKALGDPSPDSSLPNPNGSSPIFEQEQGEQEEEGEHSLLPSPLNLAGNNLSICESNSSDSFRFSSSWFSPWTSSSSSKDSLISLQSQFPMEETKPSMVSAGLANLGNTCFMNAILQCFTHTVPLLESLRSSNHSMPCDCGSEGFCILCALRDHIDLSIASSGRVISPWKLVDNLNHISSYFQRYQQEDAHEFLQCFLDKLERSSLDCMKKDESSSVQDKSLVERVFGGRLLSKLRCCNCGHCSDTYEPLIDLSLEIEEADTLPRALESFTKIENINDSETKFTCEKCKEEVVVEKQLVVVQAPQVAAFHLKRFKTDGSNVQKIEKHVEFPLELDLKPYTSGNDIDSDVELKYELYAIVEHVGFSSTSGHYFCFIRSSPDTWHRLDDSRVTRVREEFVLSQGAYILFYARKGTPWFSSVVDPLKPCLDPAIMSTSPVSVLENVENISNLSPSVNDVHCRAANEPTDAREMITLSLSPVRPKGVEVSDTRGAASGLSERINESRRDAGCSKETIDTDAVIDASTPGRGRNNFDKMSLKTENICSTSTLVGSGCHKGSARVILQPMTPPRSPSPDLVFESPEPSFRLPHDHVKSADNVTCKRSLNNVIRMDHLKSADNVLCKRASNNVVDDAQRTEALRYLSKKSLTKGRASQLLAAMVGPQSGSSLDKKRKRVGSSPCKKVSRGGGSLKTNHTMRPVAAALR